MSDQTTFFEKSLLQTSFQVGHPVCPQRFPSKKGLDRFRQTFHFTKGIQYRPCYPLIFFDASTADSNPTRHLSSQLQGEATTKEDDLSGMSMLNPVKWMTWERHLSHFAGRHAQSCRCISFGNGDFRACRQGALHARKVLQEAFVVHDGYGHGKSHIRGGAFCKGSQYAR